MVRGSGYHHVIRWNVEKRGILQSMLPRAEFLNTWCELAKSLKSKGGFTDTQTESRLVQRITPLFSMTASQQLTPSVSDFLLSRICGIHAPERLCPCPSHLLHASSAYGGRR